MNNKLFLLTVLATVVLLNGGHSVAADERPNILFCLADDWGWPHAGAYGDPVVKTPAFDRLAREGVLFHQAYVSTPSCTPCRNSIITGQQFYRLGPGANLYGALDIKHPNFVFRLRDAGYEIGHWRKAWGPGQFQQGGYTEHPCGPGMSFTQFMESRDGDKPFCFWFGTSDPHRGYKKDSGRESGMDIDRVPTPDFYPDEEPVRSDIADYYFEVQRWDGDVADALALLEEAGVLENTIIVMSGDHGMPFPRCKGNLYDWGSRVPLAIRWGTELKNPGREVTDFVSLTDLAPTFLNAAGVEVPEVITGRSLLPILQNEKDGRVQAARDHIVFGRERHTDCQEEAPTGYPARALRTDEYLYIRNYRTDRWPAGTPDREEAYKPDAWLGDCDNGPTKFYLWANRDFDDVHRRYYDLSFAKRPAEELYVVAEDGDQVKNVVEEPEFAEIKQKLAAQLTDYLKRTGDPRETAAEAKFDEYPYSGGVPKWPGEDTIEQYEQPIDFQRARQLLQKRRNGQELTADEEAYLKRAQDARARQQGQTRQQPGGRDSRVLGPGEKTGLTPLDEMSAEDKYHGEEGGLYGGGMNKPPEKHRRAAEQELAKIQPLNSEGEPSRDGRVVFISISMSNATQEFSRFKQVADADLLKSSRLTIVDCAQGGQAMAEWVNPDARPWVEAARRLQRAGVTPEQVQVAWIKLANKGPRGALEIHGRKLQEDTQAVIQNAKAKFPNLRVAYLSSRIYGGYSGGALNPEPYAYESAFAVRWLIQDQINDNQALRYAGKSPKVPLLLWGPYLWADGVTPRKSDGLRWKREDLAGDGTHPSQSGRDKVARLMLSFYKEVPLAKTWFVEHESR